MKADWLEIAKGDVQPFTAGIYVTLNRRGIIFINHTTHKRLGLPEAVLLLYDRVNNRIGLRAANPGLRNAYHLRKTRHSGRKVHALRILTEHAIDLPDTVQFPDARIDDDDVLILDLRSARVSNRYLARPNIKNGREREAV